MPGEDVWKSNWGTEHLPRVPETHATPLTTIYHVSKCIKCLKHRLNHKFVSWWHEEYLIVQIFNLGCNSKSENARPYNKGLIHSLIYTISALPCGIVGSRASIDRHTDTKQGGIRQKRFCTHYIKSILCNLHLAFLVLLERCFLTLVTTFFSLFKPFSLGSS